MSVLPPTLGQNTPPLLYWEYLKMKVEFSAEASVTIYHSMRRNIADVLNIY
jgi:hypothetical protein